MEYIAFIALVWIKMWLDEKEPKPPQNYEELMEITPKAPWNNKKEKNRIRVE
jgi:hypothetical protein